MAKDSQASKSSNLIWLDLEMTGLNPDKDLILEIALVITDRNLKTVAELGSVVVRQDAEVLNNMDDWNKKTHAKSGLIERCLSSPHNEAEAEQIVLEFVSGHCRSGESPMCGNSICQDRRFLFRYMSKLEAFFHYRNLDVSALKEIVGIWRLKADKSFAKHGKHEALADVYESIDELRHYLVNSFNVPLGETDFNLGAK